MNMKGIPAGRTSISVVVPLRDEAANVATLVEEVFQALHGLDFELILVDDGSQDDTVARIRAMGPSHPGLRLVRHGQGRGQSTALWNGVQAARGQWIAVLDGDLQNDPADLRRLLAARDRYRALDRPDSRPAGLFIGHRVRRHDTWVRRWSSRVANGVRRRLLHDGTPDTGCGLKLLRRDLFLQLPYFDHMHRFMPALVQQLGFAVVSVPVNHRPRRAGRSKYGIHNRLWVGLVDLAGVAWLARRNRRAPWFEEQWLEQKQAGKPAGRDSCPI